MTYDILKLNINKAMLIIIKIAFIDTSLRKLKDDTGLAKSHAKKKTPITRKTSVTIRIIVLFRVTAMIC